MTSNEPKAVPRVDLVDLANGAAREPLLGPDAEVIDPLLVVDLAGPDEPVLLSAAGRAAAASDRALLGIGSGSSALAASLDLTLVPGPAAGRQYISAADLDAEVGALAAAAAANPHAVLVLAGLLRRTGSLPLAAALDAESFAYSTLLGGSEFRRWLDARERGPLPPAAADPQVLVGRDGATLFLTLNRPERRNAYGREMRDALVSALLVAELDPSITRVHIDGAGSAFCAGGDLDEFGATPDLATAHFVRTRAGAGLSLHRLAERTEVLVHGACVGAGIELPAFAGRIRARPHTTFRLPELGMGLIPGAGGTVSIPRRIGRWRTLYLALSGRSINVTQAREWGLVDAIEV